MRIIPYGHQSIEQDDIDEVLSVLFSEYLTQGPKVGEFERNFSNKVGTKYSVAVNSGTSALHIACLSLGLKAGDYLWTSPISFVASANCGIYCGAKIDFVDIDQNSWNISIDNLEDKLNSAKKRNVLPKILVVVHLAGMPCDMKRIRELSVEFGFYVIEDAAHALGAIYEGTKIGSCKYSDMTVFSFHPIKAITTGEGGLVTTNNQNIYKKLVMLRSHGITREKDDLENNNQGGWYYEQQYLGYNYRMADINAALGNSQIRRLDNFIASRTKKAEYYKSALSGANVKFQKQTQNGISAWHIFIVVLNQKLAPYRERIFTDLRSKNIGVNVHYIPIHLQPYYRKMGFRKGNFPVSENYYERALTLPLYPDLALMDQEYVVESLLDVLNYYEGLK